MEEDKITLTSVGIDVGSSTSHLIFSRLHLQKNLKTYSHRYEIVRREVIYKSEIIDTPLIDRKTIDMEQLLEFFRSEYKKAGITREDIQTGVVIVTGETAKKENAAEIVNQLSKDAGDFVAATAGPNFESVIAAFGSGAVKRSEEKESTILSCDIGGGTSNIAISKNGKVLETACISVGGRLIAYDEEMTLTRIDEPAEEVIKDLGLNLQLGQKVTFDMLEKIADRFAQVLVDFINQKENSLVDNLTMTNNMNLPPNNLDEIMFSGGVAEWLYGKHEQNSFLDIGFLLAKKLKEKFPELPANVHEPENKIRATVIGAGSYTLQVSGSTCFLDDDSLSFPLQNIPVIEVDVDRNQLSEEYVSGQIGKALARYDLKDGDQMVALYFEDPVRSAYQKLKTFALGIEMALRKTVEKNIPVILIFKRDIGNSIGNVIRRETSIKDNLASIDEIEVEDGDWIDIGKPLVNGQVVPVTVKSLVFSKGKD